MDGSVSSSSIALATNATLQRHPFCRPGRLGCYILIMETTNNRKAKGYDNIIMISELLLRCQALFLDWWPGGSWIAFFFFVGTLVRYSATSVLEKKNAAYSIAVFADYTTFDFFLLYYKYKVSMYNLTH